MSAPTGEKLILLHGSRWTRSESCDSEIEWSDVWFILNHDGNGIQVREIFKDLEPVDHGFHAKDANCVQIGSSLYLLGGLSFDTNTTEWSQLSCCVRCFNTENPAQGWKICNIIPDGCDRAAVGVAGNLIYLFPRLSELIDGPYYYGYFYDISREECGSIIFPPHGGAPMDVPDFCVAINGGPEIRGVLVPQDGYIGLYNPDQNSWKKCFPFELPQFGIPDHAIFNGKLYLFFRYGFCLYVYDICTWECLLKANFKRFDYLKDEQLFLVAIADDKLCYLWYANKDGESNQGTLYFSRVDVCLDGKSQSVTTHPVKKVDVELAHLYNCLPFDSYSVQLEKSKVKSNITGIQSDSCSDQHEESKSIQGDSYSDQHEESKSIQGNSYTNKKGEASMRAEVKNIFSCWRSSSRRGKLVEKMEVHHKGCYGYQERIQMLEREVQVLKALNSL